MDFWSSYPRFQCVESFKVRCAKNRKSECSLALRCLVRVEIRSTLLAPWVYSEGFSPQFFFYLRLSLDPLALSEAGPLIFCPILFHVCYFSYCTSMSLYLYLFLSLLLPSMPSMPSIAIYLYLPHRGITLTWWCGLIPFGVTNDPFSFEK